MKSIESWADEIADRMAKKRGDDSDRSLTHDDIVNIKEIHNVSDIKACLILTEVIKQISEKDNFNVILANSLDLGINWSLKKEGEKFWFKIYEAIKEGEFS